MVDLDLPALKIQLEGATAGPWGIETGPKSDELFIFDIPTGGRIARIWNGRTRREENAEFIAAARTAMPKLIEQVELLKEELERSRAAYDNACDNWKSCVQLLTKRDADVNRLSYESDLRAAERDRSEGMYQKLLNDEKSACERGNRLAQENTALKLEVERLQIKRMPHITSGINISMTETELAYVEIAKENQSLRSDRDKDAAYINQLRNSDRILRELLGEARNRIDFRPSNLTESKAEERLIERIDQVLK